MQPNGYWLMWIIALVLLVLIFLTVADVLTWD
jgi:hypothetical protein